MNADGDEIDTSDGSEGVFELKMYPAGAESVGGTIETNFHRPRLQRDYGGGRKLQ